MIRVPCSYCAKLVWRQMRRARVTCARCRGKRNAASGSAWHAAHKTERDTGRYWREHPERRREYMALYREEHREQIRKYERKYARKAYRANKKLLANLPCDDCGMRHTPERRAAILRRMLPCHTMEVHEAWRCIWGPGGSEYRNSAGSKQLHRDLQAIGAASKVAGDGYYSLRRAA